jgi:hypothetical protein
MKTIIAGSREGFIIDDVRIAVLNRDFYGVITEVVSGGARGVDRLGEQWAKESNIPIKQFIPDWDGLGKKAGHVRNREMGDYADALIALWDGESKGTKGMIEYAQKKGLKVYVYTK